MLCATPRQRYVKDEVSSFFFCPVFCNLFHRKRPSVDTSNFSIAVWLALFVSLCQYSPIQRRSIVFLWADRFQQTSLPFFFHTKRAGFSALCLCSLNRRFSYALDQSDFLQRRINPVFIVAVRNRKAALFQRFRRVAHQKRRSYGFQHFNIVVMIAKRNGVFR